MRRVQLVDAPHQRQLGRVRSPPAVVQRRAAQPQQPALQAQAGLRVAALDQIPARGPAQRPHALFKKSRSATSCPIFSCSLRISASRSSRADFRPRSNSSTSPSLALRFHWLTWFGCSECLAAICCTVLSPRNAYFATRALKAAVNVRRFAMLTPLNPGEVHLNALSEKPLPPQLA